MTTQYFAREVDLNAASRDILNLWTLNLAGMSSAVADSKLKVGYLENPSGKGVGVVLEMQGSSDALGVICLQSRTATIGTRRVDIATLSDFTVEQAHRTLGPAVMLMRRIVALASGRFDLVFGLPNPKSAAACKRVGLKCIGSFDRFSKVTLSRRYIATVLPDPIAALLAPVVDLAIGVADRLRAMRLESRLTLEASNFGDPAIDEIWNRRQADLLLSERSKAMLDWRYGMAARGAWELCLARDAGYKPVGFVVWRPQEGVADIGDFFSIDPERLTAPLMFAFAEHARQRGVKSVGLRYFGNQSVAAGLRAAGYRLRDSNRLMFVGPSSVPEVASKDRWYITAFDNDAN